MKNLLVTEYCCTRRFFAFFKKTAGTSKTNVKIECV